MTDVKTDQIDDKSADLSENNSDDLKELQSAVTKIVDNSNLDNKSKTANIVSVTRSLITTHESFKGPLPSPKQMSEYEAIIPGSADRILSMAEKQLSHRITMEEDVISRQVKQSGKGQVFAFIICILLILLAGWCILNNAKWIAGLIVGITMISVIGLFVTGKHKIRENLRQKANKEDTNNNNIKQS